MSSILIADSGSTKTDWSLVSKGKKVVSFKTQGINPRLQNADDIKHILQTELKWNNKKHSADSIVYYGTGAGSAITQKKLGDVLKQFFNNKKVAVYSDMLGAARALCNDAKGMVSILGTGSNACYYDGKKIKEQKVSLGYIAGDEGSGNHMGKRVLQYYAYSTFDTELHMAFELKFGNDLQALINSLYKDPFPNRQLARFVELLVENRGHFMVENIIEDCLNDFFQHHILKYRQSWKEQLYFCGSVAYLFKDVIHALCDQYELTCGNIIQAPMKGLIQYHSQQL